MGGSKSILRLTCGRCSAAFEIPYYRRCKRTLCDNCLRARRREIALSRMSPHSAAAREASRAARIAGGRATIHIAQEAARNDPKLQGTEQHILAKIWTLIDPSGNVAEVRNMKLFLRDHTDIFGEQINAHKRWQELRRTLFDPTYAGKNRRTHYHGWTLACPPSTPADRAARQAEIDARREAIEAKRPRADARDHRPRTPRIAPDGYMLVADYAQKHGRTAKIAIKYIHDGRIPAVMHNGVWCVLMETPWPDDRRRKT